MIKTKKGNFLIDLVKEHIRQMNHEHHITAYCKDDLRLAKKYLKLLKKINNSQQELRINDALMGDGSCSVEFAMLFDNTNKADNFCKSLMLLHPGIIQEIT